MKQKLFSFMILFLIAAELFSQSSWKRKETVETPLQLFASTDVFNLPTAETMQAGDIYFGISHKFLTPVSEGIGELYGFDGPVLMRLALGYAITDDLLVKLGRSNLNGNLDFKVKYQAFEMKSDVLPLLVAVEAGAAYNGKAAPEPEDDARLWQFYGHLILNTMILDKSLGIGLVPSVLINSNINRKESINSFTMGAYLQYYFNTRFAVFVEANPTFNGLRNYYDSYTIGAELNTGGHFFKVILGNNSYTNTAQFLSGSKDSFDSGKLHIGFLITRSL